MDATVKLHDKGSLIIISVTANSKKTGITGIEPWRNSLKVKLTEPAKGGRANRQLKELFSNLFDAEAVILSGEKSSLKTLYINLETDKVKEKLKKSIKALKEKG